MTTPPIVTPAIAPTGNVVAFVVAGDTKEVLVRVACIDEVDTGPVVAMGWNVG